MKKLLNFPKHSFTNCYFSDYCIGVTKTRDGKWGVYFYDLNWKEPGMLFDSLDEAKKEAESCAQEWAA